MAKKGKKRGSKPYKDPKAVSHSKFMFMIQREHKKRILMKCIYDEMSFQYVAENLILEYLKDNPSFMKVLHKKAEPEVKAKKTKNIILPDEDAYAVMEQLEFDSPLQDKEIRYRDEEDDPRNQS